MHHIVEDLTPDAVKQRRAAFGHQVVGCPFVGRSSNGQLVIVGTHVPKHAYKDLRGKVGGSDEVVVEISEDLLDELIRQRLG